MNVSPNIKSQCARLSRLRAGPPTEYWINVFWSTKTGEISTDNPLYSEADVFEEIASGYPGMDYLNTIHVTATANPKIGNASAFDLREDANAWLEEGKAEEKHIEDLRRDWRASR